MLTDSNVGTDIAQALSPLHDPLPISASLEKHAFRPLQEPLPMFPLLFKHAFCPLHEFKPMVPEFPWQLPVPSRQEPERIVPEASWQAVTPIQAVPLTSAVLFLHAASPKQEPGPTAPDASWHAFSGSQKRALGETEGSVEDDGKAEGRPETVG